MTVIYRDKPPNKFCITNKKPDATAALFDLHSSPIIINSSVTLKRRGTTALVCWDKIALQILSLISTCTLGHTLTNTQIGVNLLLVEEDKCRFEEQSCLSSCLF